MNLAGYRGIWDKHLEETRTTETLLTNDPERFFGKYAKQTVEVLIRHISRSELAQMTVLEYGCGTGRLARLLAPLCKKLICADISPAMIDECRSRLGHLTNLEFLLVDGQTLPDGLRVDFAYSYAAILYFSDEYDFWTTLNLLDSIADHFCIHLHNQPNEHPRIATSESAKSFFFDQEFYRPSAPTVLGRFPGNAYSIERHSPDVRGEDMFFFKGKELARRLPQVLPRDITFFYTDGVEFQTVQPVAEEAFRRGYHIRLTRDLSAEAVVGVYCQHRPSPSAARLSVIMLHDLAQMHIAWPDYWQAEPWNEFDIGILPGPSWSRRWFDASHSPKARPRRGVHPFGWPKADLIFRDRTMFQEEAQRLRLRLGLKHERTVLYAPSWENHGKQDEFVQSLRDLPVNLLLKQAPWSSAFPTILANIRAMNVLHRDLADNIHVVDPDTSILHCLALSDVLVSDESSVLVEALLLDVPGLAVMDWLIPDCDPPRTSDVPFNFVIKTRRAGLRNDVIRVLSDLAAEKARLGILRDDHFGNLGRSSHLIMDAIDAAVDGRPCPYPALLPRMPTGSSRWLSFIGSRP